MYNVSFVFDDGTVIDNIKGQNGHITTVLSISPINNTNIKLETHEIPSGNGTVVSSSSIGGVSRTVKGAYYSDYIYTFLRMSADVVSAFRPGATGRVVIRGFVPSASSGSVSFVDVRSSFVVEKGAEVTDRSEKRESFMAQIFCPSPYWEEDAATSNTMAYQPDEVGYVLSYEGSAPALIESIVLTSITTGAMPGFKNAATGEYVYFNGVTIPTNGRVTITVYDGTLNATSYDASTEKTTDITDKIIDFSCPVHLIPGDNKLTFAGAKAQITYRKAYTGVSVKW